MDFSSLLERYAAIHWRSLSDDIRQHLQGFAAHCENAALELAERAEAAAHAAMTKVAETIAPAVAPVVDPSAEAPADEAAKPTAKTKAKAKPADPADDQPAAA